MMLSNHHRMKIPVVPFVVLLAAAACTLPLALAETRSYDFVLSAKVGEAYSPDCENIQMQRRWLFLAEDTANGVPPSMPGPLIEATEGDTIRLTVTNDHHSIGATLHYHGVHQKGTPWADGPVHVTQCSLGPLQSQVYEFEAYPPGTHYWHAHQAMDVADGMTGPIIIHPKEPEPFDYDEERMLFLQDFYIQTGSQQEAGLDNYPFTWVGNPNSLLINGKGLASACLEGGASYNNSNSCLVNTCNDTLAWTSVVPVEAGKTYRFRIINSAQLTMQNVAIAGHNMTIVEVEGTMVEPVTVSNYDLAPGQRVSVLVTADQDDAGQNFWIETSVRERDIPGLVGRAILSYGGGTDPQLPSLDDLPPHPMWNESDAALEVEAQLATLNVSAHPGELVALEAAESDVDRYVMVGTQNKLLDGEGNVVQLRWAMNNISFYPPPDGDPLIGLAVQESRKLGWPLDGPINGTVDLPRTPPVDWNWTLPVQDEGGPGENLGSQEAAVIRLTKGTVVEFVLQNLRALNGAAEFHPWHLHGHSFWVVGRGDGNYDPDRDVPTYNLVDPVLRDTVTLWPLQWTAIRFVADSPGVWLFHCHITAHQIMGMSFAIVVDPDDIGTPSESVEFCGMQSLDADSAAGTGGGTEDDGGGGDTDTDGGGDDGSGAMLSGGGMVTSVAVLMAAAAMAFSM
jgi:FtsP/CotA-like multicopper oxidase with cupredoxin domain